MPSRGSSSKHNMSILIQVARMQMPNDTTKAGKTTYAPVGRLTNRVSPGNPSKNQNHLYRLHKTVHYCNGILQGW
jgi:hypothetical protein